MPIKTVKSFVYLNICDVNSNNRVLITIPPTNILIQNIGFQMGNCRLGFNNLSLNNLPYANSFTL